MPLFRSPRLRLPLLALLALGATLLSAQAAWACEAEDQYGEPRACTFLEEYGECLYSVFDSHEQCLAAAETKLGGLACHVGTQVDLSVCNLSLPLEFIGKILGAFREG